jgi:hypothetical protein
MTARERLPDRQHMTSKASYARFRFHERVLADHRNLWPSTILLAGFIMHQYKTRDGTSFQFSIRAAAKFFQTTRWTMQRACRQLEVRGHLCRLRHNHAPGARTSAGTFVFGEGLSHEAGGPQYRGHDGLSHEATIPVRESLNPFPVERLSKSRRIPL